MLFLQSGAFLRCSWQVFIYCQKTHVYTAAFPAVEGENKGEKGILSDGQNSSFVCGREGRVPLRNRMGIAVTLVVFLSRLGYKWRMWKSWSCRSLVFLWLCASSQSSLQRHLTSSDPAQQPPRWHARPATALRQGHCVLQGQVPPAALALQFAWQLL